MLRCLHGRRCEEPGPLAARSFKRVDAAAEDEQLAKIWAEYQKADSFEKRVWLHRLRPSLNCRELGLHSVRHGQRQGVQAVARSSPCQRSMYCCRCKHDSFVRVGTCCPDRCAASRIDPNLSAYRELKTIDSSSKVLSRTDTEGWMSGWEILTLEGLPRPEFR